MVLNKLKEAIQRAKEIADVNVADATDIFLAKHGHMLIAAMELAEATDAWLRQDCLTETQEDIDMSAAVFAYRTAKEPSND